MIAISQPSMLYTISILPILCILSTLATLLSGLSTISYIFCWPSNLNFILFCLFHLRNFIVHHLWRLRSYFFCFDLQVLRILVFCWRKWLFYQNWMFYLAYDLSRRLSFIYVIQVHSISNIFRIFAQFIRILDNFFRSTLMLWCIYNCYFYLGSTNYINFIWRRNLTLTFLRLLTHIQYLLFFLFFYFFIFTFILFRSFLHWFLYLFVPCIPAILPNCRFYFVVFLSFFIWFSQWFFACLLFKGGQLVLNQFFRVIFLIIAIAVRRNHLNF